MKNKLLKISILAIIFVMLMQVAAFAALGNLTLTVTTDQDTYKVGDKVTVTINWEKEVEAAGFTLKYDDEKLTFDSTTVGENFYNAETEGEVLFNWASFDGTQKTEVTFVFVAKAEGTAEILVENAKGFGVGDENNSMDEATGYTYSNATIKISDENSGDDDTSTMRYISFPFIIYNGESSVDLYSGVEITDYTMYYQYVEVSDEILAKINKFKEDSEDLDLKSYYSQYDALMTENAKYDENAWTKTEDGSFKIDLSGFDGTKNFVLWVKLEMPDKTVYESQMYQLNGSGQVTNTPGATENVGGDKETSSGTTSGDTTTAEGKMPQAGLEAKELLAIVLFAIIAIVGFKGYRRLSDV